MRMQSTPRPRWRLWRTIALVLLAGLIALPLPASAQERFSGLSGIVRDDSGAVLPGVSVTIVNKETAKSYAAVTGGDGAYRVLDLEPGRYSVKFELSGFSSTEVADVNLLLGKSLQVDTALKVGGLTEAVQVTNEAPLIDMRGTTIAHNITAEEFDRMPKARSFQTLAMASPSVNTGEIEGGFQVNGASGAENSFTIDGVVTNSLVDGRSRQDAVYEYLQEVQVKTGGISAEYGGALGGVISAVTKSGGNAFHGEGHYYYTGAGISARPVERLVLDPRDDRTVSYFQEDRQKNDRHEPGMSIGGPIVKDKLFFFVSAAPRYTRRTNDYLFSNGAEPGSISQKRNDVSVFGKVNYDVSNRLRTSFSMLYTPTKSTGSLPAYDGAGAQYLSSTRESNLSNLERGFEQPQKTYSGTVDFTLTPTSLLSLRGGYFDDNYKDTGIPAFSAVSYSTSNLGLDYPIPDNLRGGIGFQNTPRAQINQFDHTTRGYVNLDYVQALNFAGQHSFKGGFGVQHTVNDVDVSYPGGGYVFVWWNSAFTSDDTGITDRGPYGYYEINDVATRGKAGSDIYSLYVQDQWSVNRLTMNLGLRTEKETIPSFRKDIRPYGFRFGFSDKIAPRLGASYDLHGDGKTKMYANWGRYYDWTKYELSRGTFGADVWTTRYRSLDTTDVFSLSGTNTPGRNLWGPGDAYRDQRIPSFDAVDPDLKPMAQDNMNVGFETQLGEQMVFTANYVHSNLVRTIEDLGVLVNGSEEYKYVNPGEGIARTMIPSNGLTPEFTTPKPKRQYDALELTLAKRYSNNWFGSASYVYSRLYGNYAGLANSDEISTPTSGRSSATAQQSGGSIARPGSSANRAYDLDQLMYDSHGNLNVLGRLATDRPHVVKLYGAYLFPFGTQVGAFFYGGSGTPISRTVESRQRIPLFVDGRGSMGRTDVLTQTDLLVTHDLSLKGQKKLRLELNVLNVFNQKTSRHIFNNLNRSRRPSSGMDLSQVNLAAGYDYNALLAATSDGANAIDPRFGMDDLFNPGLSARFGVRFTF